MTLLSFNTKVTPIQSSTAVTSTVTALADDTQAVNNDLVLSQTQTVLVIYVANGADGSTNYQTGLHSAIGINGTDHSDCYQAPGTTNYSVRNQCFWIGQLAAGTHTIHGRLASMTAGQTVTVSNRTLLIYVLNGDEGYFVENTTPATTNSTSYSDDSNATHTHTPSATANAVFLYGVTDSAATTPQDGGKICIKVGNTQYTACEAEQSTYGPGSSYSLLTTYGLTSVSGSTVVKGQFAACIANTTTISKSYLGVLYFDPNLSNLDLGGTATQVSSSSTTFVDDAQMSISRTYTGELLVFGQATRKATGGAGKGFKYGIYIGSDLAQSATSPCGAAYAESVFVGYGQSTSGATAIKGRYCINGGTTADKIDERSFVAIWMSPVSYPSIAASMTGGGTFTNTYGNYIADSPNISGAGTFTITYGTYFAQHPTISGMGSFTAGLGNYLAQYPTISGTGGFTANGNVLVYKDSTLLGSGSFTNNIAFNLSILSSLSGLGSFTNVYGAFDKLLSTISGNGSFSDSIDIISMLQILSSLSGLGSITATTLLIQYLQNDSTLSGLGDFTSTIAKLLNIDSSIGATGSFGAYPHLYDNLHVDIYGSGEFTNTTSMLLGILSSISGSGILSERSYIYDSLTVNASGLGTVITDLMSTKYIESLLYGDGLVNDKLTSYFHIDSNISGSGLLTNYLYLFDHIESNISGSGLLSNDYNILASIRSNVSGNGYFNSQIHEQLPLFGLSIGHGSTLNILCFTQYLNSILSGKGKTLVTLSGSSGNNATIRYTPLGLLPPFFFAKELFWTSNVTKLNINPMEIGYILDFSNFSCTIDNEIDR